MQQRNQNCSILKMNSGYYHYYGLYPWGSKAYAVQTVCCNDFNLQVPCKCSANISNNIDTKNQHNLSYTDKLTLKGVSILQKQFTFENYLFFLHNQRA